MASSRVQRLQPSTHVPVRLAYYVVLISQVCLEQAVYTPHASGRADSPVFQPEMDEIAQVTFLPNRSELLLY